MGGWLCWRNAGFRGTRRVGEWASASASASARASARGHDFCLSVRRLLARFLSDHFPNPVPRPLTRPSNPYALIFFRADAKI